MLKLSTLIVILFLSTITLAQRRNVYFLKNDGEYTSSKDSADYIRVVSEPDSGSNLYNIAEFYKNGKKKLAGKSLRIDPPRFDGAVIAFYENGHKESIKSFVLGSQVDEEYDYFPNGKPSVVKQFSDATHLQLYKGLTYNCLIMEAYDSLGTTLVTNGNGFYKEGGYQTGVDNHLIYIEEEGKIKDGRMDGEWKGLEKNPKITFAERYDKGMLLDGVATDTAGTVTTYIKTRQSAPEFVGGIENFYRFLGQTVRYPAPDRERNIQGRVILNFIIGKDGTISNILVKESVSPTIDAECRRVMMLSPAWEPAQRFGRAISCRYTVPIAFTLSN